MEKKWSNGWSKQLQSTSYGAYEEEMKMLIEMPLAQAIVKSLAQNLSPLVLSFLTPMLKQSVDSDLHLCTHVREGNGEFQISYVERQMDLLSDLNQTLVDMNIFAKSRNAHKVSVFVASDTQSAWSWFGKNAPSNWLMIKPSKERRRPESGVWFGEHGSRTNENLTQLEKDEAMAEAVADVFALGECDALYIPRYSSFSVVGIMLARADGRKVFFREASNPWVSPDVFKNSSKFVEYPDDHVWRHIDAEANSEK
ncbi:hypothetical protein ACHAXA_007006 [Cyclostephanos tholiformis]|uniref:Uncharacterized protein n=1 Tax=Cyclostephanos tholiformis TaxID=382380 RepID=A0ABD3RD78_9STRA